MHVYLLKAGRLQIDYKIHLFISKEIRQEQNKKPTLSECEIYILLYKKKCFTTRLIWILRGVLELDFVEHLFYNLATADWDDIYWKPEILTLKTTATDSITDMNCGWVYIKFRLTHAFEWYKCGVVCLVLLCKCTVAFVFFGHFYIAFYDSSESLPIVSIKLAYTSTLVSRSLSLHRFRHRNFRFSIRCHTVILLLVYHII